MSTLNVNRYASRSEINHAVVVKKTDEFLDFVVQGVDTQNSTLYGHSNSSKVSTDINNIANRTPVRVPADFKATDYHFHDDERYIFKTKKSSWLVAYPGQTIYAWNDSESSIDISVFRKDAKGNIDLEMISVKPGRMELVQRAH